MPAWLSVYILWIRHLVSQVRLVPGPCGVGIPSTFPLTYTTLHYFDCKVTTAHCLLQPLLISNYFNHEPDRRNNPIWWSQTTEDGLTSTALSSPTSCSLFLLLFLLCSTTSEPFCALEQEDGPEEGYDVGKEHSELWGTSEKINEYFMVSIEAFECTCWAVDL